MSGLDDFIFELPYESLKPALLMSLLSVWVLVGVFWYLNRYTKRHYFSVWTAAWLFYALWLTLCIRFSHQSGQRFIALLQYWCLGASAVFLLWGAVKFLKLFAPQRLFGLFLAFLFAWSYSAIFLFENSVRVQAPIFGLIGLASEITGLCFFRMRQRREYIGAGLLAMGFCLWGVYLGVFPLLQASSALVSATFFISAVLQLFIAVSMIVLVLEEVRTQNETTSQRLRNQKTETELLRSKMVSTEERYRSLFDQASEGIVIAEAEKLVLLEANDTALRLFGLASGELGEHQLPEYCSLRPALAPTAGRDWFAVIQSARQFQIVRRDGSATPVEVDGALVNYHGQEAFQFFIREITERTRLEQQLRQTEKLSALGKMISGVAHELNNPMAVIKGYLDLILRDHSLSKDTRRDLEKVAQESNRAARLVSNFLSFAREQPKHREAVRLDELMEGVLALRRFDLDRLKVEIVRHFEPDLPATMADPDQLQQVVVNLINNSLQAMENWTGPRRLLLAGRSREEVLEFEIEDSGPGIPAEVLPHIFEPFFTTKEVGIGTGLGLSISHSIMSDHQGRIFYKPGRNGGACFQFELPVVRPPEPSVQRETKALDTAAPDPAQSRILIVDDERSLAELLGEMLGLLGYGTALCGSGAQALEMLEKSHFDLVLSDYRMPVMDGREFYQQAIRRFPYLCKRIIFLTGDVVSEDTVDFLESTGNPHLPKPFQLAQVEQAVVQALQQAAAAEPAQP